MSDVETRHEDEEEEALEAEIPTVETNLKKPMRRAEQEREDCGTCYLQRIDVLSVSEVVVL